MVFISSRRKRGRNVSFKSKKRRSMIPYELSCTPLLFMNQSFIVGGFDEFFNMVLWVYDYFHFCFNYCLSACYIRNCSLAQVEYLFEYILVFYPWEVSLHLHKLCSEICPYLSFYIQYEVITYGRIGQGTRLNYQSLLSAVILSGL